MHTACDCVLRYARDNAMRCRSQLTIQCCIWPSTYKGWCILRVSTAISCAEHQYKQNRVTHAAYGDCWPRHHFMKHHQLAMKYVVYPLNHNSSTLCSSSITAWRYRPCDWYRPCNHSECAHVLWRAQMCATSMQAQLGAWCTGTCWIGWLWNETTWSESMMHWWWVCCAFSSVVQNINASTSGWYLLTCNSLMVKSEKWQTYELFNN